MQLCCGTFYVSRLKKKMAVAIIWWALFERRLSYAGVMGTSACMLFCIKDLRKPFIKDIILQGWVFFMGGWAYGWGVQTVVQKEESSVCLSGNSYRRQPQQACVGGGGSFVWAPPQSVRCPIVKTLGVNCNREVPSLNLSETTFGNALALHTVHATRSVMFTKLGAPSCFSLVPTPRGTFS